MGRCGYKHFLISLLAPGKYVTPNLLPSIDPMISTGGIIALGLGVKQWSLNHCVSEFIRLCDRAFTPREFDNVAGFRQATTLKHGSKYKTQPLQRALREAFDDEQLYGGPRKGHYEYDTKVAVTTTSGTGQRGLVLANYSRQEENEPNYKFEFPHHLQVWEAASATSAAPPFFKPFESRAKKTYMDGAIYYNNPVKVADNERRFLWPDVTDNPPDLILSIGTGMNQRKIDKELESESANQSTVRQAKPGSASRTSRLKQSIRTKSANAKPFKVVSKYFQVLVCATNFSLPTLLAYVPRSIESIRFWTPNVSGGNFAMTFSVDRVVKRTRRDMSA